MMEEPKQKEESEIQILEIHRADVSNTDVEDLRILRTQQSHSKDWSGATNEEVLNDLFHPETNSYVIRDSLSGYTGKRIITTGN